MFRNGNAISSTTLTDNKWTIYNIISGAAMGGNVLKMQIDSVFLPKGSIILILISVFAFKDTDPSTDSGRMRGSVLMFLNEPEILGDTNYAMSRNGNAIASTTLTDNKWTIYNIISGAAMGGNVLKMQIDFAFLP
ncbi:hypothetical protein CDAR_200201 [Caerostris darwini]|uniref:Uncharacterized protein n=1 Tax=Caerostris darwini TaxID=1538125 RepID=A0AAV4PS03_9ARAC|nr:hypothetical protein CDAR_200201 [Caerostris darwini]